MRILIDSDKNQITILEPVQFQELIEWLQLHLTDWREYKIVSDEGKNHQIKLPDTWVQPYRYSPLEQVWCTNGLK